MSTAVAGKLTCSQCRFVQYNYKCWVYHEDGTAHAEHHKRLDKNDPRVCDRYPGCGGPKRTQKIYGMGQCEKGCPPVWQNHILGKHFVHPRSGPQASLYDEDGYLIFPPPPPDLFGGSGSEISMSPEPEGPLPPLPPKLSNIGSDIFAPHKRAKPVSEKPVETRDMSEASRFKKGLEARDKAYYPQQIQQPKLPRYRKEYVEQMRLSSEFRPDNLSSRDRAHVAQANLATEGVEQRQPNQYDLRSSRYDQPPPPYAEQPTAKSNPRPPQSSKKWTGQPPRGHPRHPTGMRNLRPAKRPRLPSAERAEVNEMAFQKPLSQLSQNGGGSSDGGDSVEPGAS